MCDIRERKMPGTSFVLIFNRQSGERESLQKVREMGKSEEEEAPTSSMHTRGGNLRASKVASTQIQVLDTIRYVYTNTQKLENPQI